MEAVAQLNTVLVNYLPLVVKEGLQQLPLPEYSFVILLVVSLFIILFMFTKSECTEPSVPEDLVSEDESPKLRNSKTLTKKNS